MASDTVVGARVDGQVKEKAAKVLGDLGLSVSDAIRLLLVRAAAENALPLAIDLPNAETRAAMAELEQGAGKSFGSVADLMADLNAEDELKRTGQPQSVLASGPCETSMRRFCRLPQTRVLRRLVGFQVIVKTVRFRMKP